MLFILYSNYSKAQSKKDSVSKISFSSYIGKSITQKDLNKNISNGFIAMTGLEYRLNKKSFIVGEINFDTYNYKNEGTTFSINNNLSIISVSLLHKYVWFNKKLEPYIKYGFGIASLTYPKVDESKQNYLFVQNETNYCLHYQASVGLKYGITLAYGIFADVGFQQYLSKNIFNKQFNNLLFRIGIISSL